MAEDLQTLLEKHEKRILSGDERVRLHELINQKYDVGEEIKNYNCPNCGKFLVNTLVTGPTCVEYKGGCGFNYITQQEPVGLIKKSKS
jgi:RNase P subunit RPR2